MTAPTSALLVGAQFMTHAPGACASQSSAFGLVRIHSAYRPAFFACCESSLAGLVGMSTIGAALHSPTSTLELLPGDLGKRADAAGW